MVFLSSSDIFQRKVFEIFEGLSVVYATVDDILIYGNTLQDHDANLINVLEHARDLGTKFNTGKCVIRVTELPFFGHTVSTQPDPSKVENWKCQIHMESARLLLVW